MQSGVKHVVLVVQLRPSFNEELDNLDMVSFSSDDQRSIAVTISVFDMSFSNEQTTQSNITLRDSLHDVGHRRRSHKQSKASYCERSTRSQAAMDIAIDTTIA